MEKGKIKRASLELSAKLVHLYDNIERKGFLKNQLARAGTSIGANVHEAEYAESKVDFIHKLKIALKECNETEYWLQVLATTCPNLTQISQELRYDAGVIRRMLIASIKTCQGNTENANESHRKN